MALSEGLRAWLVPGLAGAVSTVDPRGRPRIARVWAARPLVRSDIIEFYVLRPASEHFVEAVSAGRRAALNLIEVTSYWSRMFKGPCRVSSAEFDPFFYQDSVDALGRAFASVGLPSDSARIMVGHAGDPRSVVSIELTVESVFDQSPKPGAGAPL